MRTSLGGHVEHLLVYAATALLAASAYLDHSRIKIAVSLILYAAALEYLQRYAPGRLSSLLDLTFSTTGVLIGLDDRSISSDACERDTRALQLPAIRKRQPSKHLLNEVRGFSQRCWDWRDHQNADLRSLSVAPASRDRSQYSRADVDLERCWPPAGARLSGRLDGLSRHRPRSCASGEVKAIETALDPRRGPGSLSPSRFEKPCTKDDRSGDGLPATRRSSNQVRDFFAAPAVSIRGWGARACCSSADCAGRWRRFWTAQGEGMCSLSATAPLARCCSAITPKWRSIEPMINRTAGAIISRS